MGGGTDLLVSIDEGFVRADSIVDLRRIPEDTGIAMLPDGSWRIGAGTRIHDIANDARIVQNFRALAEACDVVGTPALRQMGTIGGNLCQRPRCWYLRRDVPCLKNGGADCPAKDGENQYHAILDGGPCYIVHPSDPAVALTALDAIIDIGGPSPRQVPISDFYRLPTDRLDAETVLVQGEFVRSVILRRRPVKSSYEKLMQRGAWDFALVSIAGAKHDDGSVRIVLGGVAPRPWRVPESLEEDVSAGQLDADAIAVIAERALYDAKPLAKNAYKVRLAETLIRRAITHLLS
jgi:xanthine dehydrogenase YagS FAD-binding subunit